MKSRILLFAAAVLLGPFVPKADAQPPQIVTQPTNETVLAGSAATFSVAVSGAGPFTYQWQFNGTNFPGVVTTVAGNGTNGYSGDGGAATNAELGAAIGVALDASGNVFIADGTHNVIRKVGTNGIITTAAGNGINGYSGDGGAATNAELGAAFGVALDAFGNLFIADTDNNVIRKVGTNGIITTAAGNGTSGYAGDGGPATQAELNFPIGVAVDVSGNLFIADEHNQRIRKVGTNGIIATVAGNGNYGYSGDGGAATNTELGWPTGVALDAFGNLFMADSGNGRIRKVGTNGIITTVAGNGNYGYSGDGGAATNAEMAGPIGLAVDVSGNLFIADTDNNRIRKVGINGIITTVAGNGIDGYSGDGGGPVVAELNYPTGVAVDAAGDLFIADDNNQRIREVVPPPSPALVLIDISAANAGAYDVVVSNPSGSVTSSVVTLQVLLPPTIVTQPQSQAVAIGNNATLGVAATGAAPLAYQWYFDTAPLPGQTNTTLLISGAVFANAGSYDVLVTNLYGSVTSAVAVVSVGAPPAITTPPESQTNLFNSTVSFSVGVSGTGPFTYQWQFNGANLAQGPTLVLTNISAANAGAYQVVVSSPYGSATSGGVTLQVVFPPALVTPPQSQAVVIGGNASLGVAATGTAPLAYQWYFDTAPLPGRTNPTLLVSGAAFANAGSYDVVVTNLYGSVTSAVAVVSVGAPPAITTPPLGQTNLFNSTVSFSVGVSGTGPFTYQWQFNGVNLAQGPTLVLTNISGANAGAYQVVVSSPYGSVTSGVVTLQVLLPPAIVTPPQSQVVGIGGNATLSVAATGTAPLAYQWYFDAAPLPGQTNTSLLISGAAFANLGSYNVVVTNLYGSATSAVAMLGIGAPPAITTQPLSQTNLYNSTVSFSVGVSGAGPFTYQWQFNATNTLSAFISTVAGNGTLGYTGDGGAATSAELHYPSSVAVDASGNLFIADTDNNRIRKVGTNGIITTMAGGYGIYGYFGDGGAATNATLYSPSGVAVDASGNLFIADTENNRIRKVGTNGIITTVAGGGSQYPGDGGAATSAELNNPSGVAVDPSGNLFIADTSGMRIREVGTNGIITTVAGNGNYGYSGDGGLATSAELRYPYGVAVDATGNLFIADSDNDRIRKVGTNGIITTVAGNGNYGYYGDGGPATAADLSYPAGVAVDASGNLFIADEDNQRIREVGTNGIFTTVAGNGISGYSGDGGAATNADLNSPSGVAVDLSGNLFIADDDNSVIREAVPPGQSLVLNNVSAANAGSYDVVVSSPYGSVTSSVATLLVLLPPTLVTQPQSQAVVIGSNATLSVAATGTAPFECQWYFDGAPLPGQTKTALPLNAAGYADAGSYSVVVTNLYGAITSAAAVVTVGIPPGITTQPLGQTNLFNTTVSFSVGVSGTGPFTYQWQLNGTNLFHGIITTVAGSGNYGYSGDGGIATNAWLYYPEGVAVDLSGNLFIVDGDNQRIRKVGTDGIITTVAGNGDYGYSGDGGAATNAELGYPEGVAVDASGNLFIAEIDNCRIRKVGTNGIITTVAGNGIDGYSGDGGAATNASLSSPSGVTVDASGNLFIADSGNDIIRKVDTGGIVTTVAGNRNYGYSGDGGAATSAELNYPAGVAVDLSGNLFIVDEDNQRIRKVATNGIITTVAGNGTQSYSGDGGPAINAELNYPAGVAVDASGNLFIADTDNNVIREVGASGIIEPRINNGYNISHSKPVRV